MLFMFPGPSIVLGMQKVLIKCFPNACTNKWSSDSGIDCSLDLQHHKWTRGRDPESSTYSGYQHWKVMNLFPLLENLSQPRNEVPESLRCPELRFGTRPGWGPRQSPSRSSIPRGTQLPSARLTAGALTLPSHPLQPRFPQLLQASSPSRWWHIRHLMDLSKGGQARSHQHSSLPNSPTEPVISIKGPLS